MCDCCQRVDVSPGFTSRPSLSGGDALRLGQAGRSVAGIHVPAFVERWWRSCACSARQRVAGIHVPAFVER